MKKDTVISYIIITIGALIAAFAIDTLLIPNTILDGGVTGISMVISKLSGISLSILVLIINIPFVLIGYKHLGKYFLARTIYGMIFFSLFIKLLEIIEPITNEMLLATVFGGALLGIGVGLVIRFGGCVDGTESVALVLTKKLNLSVGQIILIFNLIIYTVAAFLFGIDRALYSILTYFITFKMIDLVSTGLEQTKSAIIITDKGKELAREIYNKLGRTTTMMEGKGLLSGDKEILYCVLTRIEIYELKKIVSEMDESAFISIGEVTDIIGNHIKSYSKKLKTIVDEEII
ncbi:MAG: YitT family protein [Bacilli bacterium]|nr:YitT family protein [Bacilli bacterium]